MNWKLKAHTLAILSRLPAGRRLYHSLQQWAGTNRPNPERDLGRAFELVELVRQGGGRIEGAACLEIGTGWHPYVPFVLALGGARKVVTIDVNPWLTFADARETWLSLEPFLPEISARLGLAEHEVRERHGSVGHDAASLDDLLRPLMIDYVYPGDARDTGLGTATLDVVVSSNVLEHIPPDVQSAIHLESFRVLRPGGVSAHRFNPQDHYTLVDPSITHGNFLRYSTAEWRWYGGSGLAYHNRLRSRDYRELFRAAGFQIRVDRQRVDEPTLNAIRSGQLPVHEEFARYSLEELSVDYMWLACEKPVEVGPSAEGASFNSDTWRLHPEPQRNLLK